MRGMGTMTCGKSDPGEGTTQPEGGSAGGSAFDQWLTHHLKQLYDPVVSEPLPPDLLRLLSLRLD